MTLDAGRLEAEPRGIILIKILRVSSYQANSYNTFDT